MSKASENKQEINYDSLRKILDQTQTYPTEFMYKFIIPSDQVDTFKTIFKNEEINFKFSKKGNFMSCTFEKKVQSTDDIIQGYKDASSIKGLLAL